MKKIGLIGGMSFESSVHYYERINKQVNEKAGGLTSAEMLIYNVNFSEIRKLMLNNKWDEIGEELARIAKTLERAGADYIAIATNTMHKLADHVQSKIEIPLIHIADCVADKCKKQNIKKVGLIGTKYTMVEDFLKKRLEDKGLEITTPRIENEIKEIDRIIFEELCKGIIKEKSKDYYINIINKMVKENNIEGIIFGCTEIEMLIKKDELNISVFDTTQCHIDTLVDYCLEKK